LIDALWQLQKGQSCHEASHWYPDLKVGMSKFDDKLAGSILLSVEVGQELNPHSRCKLLFRRGDQDPGGQRVCSFSYYPKPK
jgi:hypothetical protein